MENKRPNSPQGLNKNRPIDGIVDTRISRAAPGQSYAGKNSAAASSEPQSAISEEPVTPLPQSQPVPTISPSHKKRNFIIAAAFLLVAVVIVGIVVVINSSKTKAPAKPKETQRESRTTANADEKKPVPDAIASYKVAADLPRVISIEKIKIKSRVLALGVKSNNELKAPVNIYDTGWYLESAKPGDPGAMLIDGHVTGPTQKGIFYDLKKLVAGDIIEIERGDGKKFNYSVVNSKTYDKDKVDMAAALTPVKAGNPGLNLITCTGSFNSQSDQYEDRLVVFASLQN